MAPIGVKLWGNAFRMIWNISFFDAERKNWMIFLEKNVRAIFYLHKTGVLEELRFFERQWQLPRKKLLPEVGLFLGRVPWRGGKRLNMCRKPRLGTKNDFNHLVS